jgi:hypothetical protein
MKQLWIVVVVLASTPACGAKKPCSGGGMELDPRPSPSWLGTPPAGAIACHQIDKSTDSEDRRSYEIGSSPSAGFGAWSSHLAASGWQHAETVKNEKYEFIYRRADQRIRLFCSSHITEKGWCTLTLLQ